MMENVAVKVAEMLEKLAEQLGVAAERLYPVLLKQAKIDGLVKLIVPLAFIVGCAVIIYFLGKWVLVVDNGDLEDVMFINIIPIAVLLTNLGILFFNVQQIATALFNPDWYIFNELLAKLIQ